jgi:lysophospholipase L1-like esterase
VSRLLFAVLVTLWIAAPAAAELRVMCYGDALTSGGDEVDPTNSYPGELQRLRPDLEVVNEGRDGDVSGNFARFEAAIADWPPDVVVLMLGTNDAVCAPTTPGCDTATPEQSAANILRMAESAQSKGAKVFVLTPPPAVCKADCDTLNEVAYKMWTRDAFTAKLADVLRRSQPIRGVRVADLRRRVSDSVWERLSTDGLHPSPEGNRMIARFVSAYISHKGTGTQRASTEQRSTGVSVAGGRRSTQRRDQRREARRDDEANPFARKPLDHRYAR